MGKDKRTLDFLGHPDHALSDSRIPSHPGPQQTSPNRGLVIRGPAGLRARRAGRNGRANLPGSRCDACSADAFGLRPRRNPSSDSGAAIRCTPTVPCRCPLRASTGCQRCRSPVPSLSRDPVHWLVMAEVIRASRYPCSPYVSLLMMFLNLVALTGRSTISLPS
jgi:hypothetical protein